MRIKKWIKNIVAAILIIFIVSGPIIIPMIYSEINKEIAQEKQPWSGIITLWDFPRLDIESGTRYKWIRDKIKTFEKRNPGVYIELSTIDWETGMGKLLEAAKEGNSPDIAPVGNNYSFISGGYLEKLDSYLTNDEINSFRNSAIRAVKYNESIWGMPWMMTSYNLYLNLDLFSERGILPPKDGNWTYDEFIAAAKELTFDRNGDGKIDVYGFNSFLKPSYYNLWGFLYADGATLLDQRGDSFTFNDDKALSALQKLWDMKYKYGVVPEGFGEIDENKAWDMFYNTKEVAMYAAGSWAVNVLESLKESGKGFNFTVANYPIGSLRTPVSVMDNVAAYGIFKQQDKEKLDMCMKFLKFIASDQEQTKLTSLGVFPVKKNIEIYNSNREMMFIEQNLSYVQGLPRTKHLTGIEEILVEEVKKTLTNTITPKEAIQNISARVKALMDQ